MGKIPLYNDPILHEFCEAMLKSSKRAIELIETHGINYKNVRAYGRGATFMHTAALCGDLQMMQYLIDKGADVNAADYFGTTPLHESIIHCHEPKKCRDAVELLLKNGAFISTLPLQMAEALSKHEVVSLIEQTKVNRTLSDINNQNKPKITSTTF